MMLRLTTVLIYALFYVYSHTININTVLLPLINSEIIHEEALVRILIWISAKVSATVSYPN